MASSSCIKCGGFSFELREAKVAKASYKIYFVQCTSCGGVVNAMILLMAGPIVDKIVARRGGAATNR